MKLNVKKGWAGSLLKFILRDLMPFIPGQPKGVEALPSLADARCPRSVGGSVQAGCRLQHPEFSLDRFDSQDVAGHAQGGLEAVRVSPRRE